MTILGLIAFFLTVLLLIAALILALVSFKKHNTRLVQLSLHLMRASFYLHSLALIALLVLLLTQDYTVAYVNAVITPTMPVVLKLTAVWGGQAGSLFFWGWVLNACLFITIVRPAREDSILPALVSSLVVLFFSAISLLIENPFARIWQLPDGNLSAAIFSPAAGAIVRSLEPGLGLNPLLRHPGMIIHPPILYIGYAAFLLPFADTIARLLKPDAPIHSTKRIRVWLLIAWTFLTAGIALGSWWSYDVLGWGGYWGWDPVEVASLLPWLSATALLHSLLIESHSRIFKRFNIAMVLLTFMLITFSIFITRSGAAASVHAFSASPIKNPLLGFLILSTLVSLALFAWRWKSLASEREINSYFNREALLTYGNLVLLALLVVCLWGVLYPMISAISSGQQVAMSVEYYERATAPLFYLLVLLLGICPLIGWQIASFKNLGAKMLLALVLGLAAVVLSYILGIHQWKALVGLGLVVMGIASLLIKTFLDLSGRGFKKVGSYLSKHRRRYGAYLVHLGILLIALGIVGMETMQVTVQKTLNLEESLQIGNYELTHLSVSQSHEHPEYGRLEAEVLLSKNGRALKTLTPQRDIYKLSNMLVTVPGVRHSLMNDVYVILMDQNLQQGYASYQVSINPLVNFLWIGSFALIAGAVLAAIKTKKKHEADLD